MCRTTTPGSTGSRISLVHIFKGFLYVGCVGLGGGGAAHIHAAMVRNKKWVTEEAFLEGATFAQLTPGPNFSNLAAFIGARLGGSPGAVAALIGVLLPGTLVVLALAYMYAHYPVTQNPLLQGALRGVGSAAVGVLTVVVLQTLPSALRSRHGISLLVLAFIGVGVLHTNIVWVLVVLLPYGLWVNRPGGQTG